MEKERKKILNDAKREAKSIIMRARVEFEEALREIREAQSRTLSEVNLQASAIRDRLREAQNDLRVEDEYEIKGEPVSIENLEPGASKVVGSASQALYWKYQILMTMFW